MNYSNWVNNEYELWVKALKESTVNNFKEHAMVKRMLGEIEPELFVDLLPEMDFEVLTEIDNIGRANKKPLSGTAMRMIYYALQVLEKEPKSIIEIGGGVGQFYAIMRYLGYKGTYFITDLPDIRKFQIEYLKEVSRIHGLELGQLSLNEYDMCVSFYALGEFDDNTKKYYVENVLPCCKNGFIIWNPHSGATPVIPFECRAEDEFPVMNKGNLKLTW